MSSTSTSFSFDQVQIDRRLLLMAILPMDFLTGMRIKVLTNERCEVVVRYKWLNKNPFRSTFWAVLGMTAEMSSGALLIMYTHKLKPSIAMLVVEQHSKYYKKAVGKTTFICESGKDIAAEVVCPMKGYNEAGDLICEYSFTWSLKARKS
jgi:hypothetical protein